MQHRDLQRVHRLLCSPFVEEDRFRAALGGGRGDIGTIIRYLSVNPLSRPALSVYFDAPAPAIRAWMARSIHQLNEFMGRRS